MSIKTCQHVRENGIFCQSPAMHRRNYCHFHMRVIGRRMAMAKARAHNEHWKLTLPPLEDIHSVQVALMHVLDAIADDRIDNRRAGLLLYGLQQASANIQNHPSWIGPSRFAVDPDLDDNYVTSYPDFEQEFSLPKRLDLDIPPEQAFPPPPEPPTPLQDMEELRRSVAEYEIARAKAQQLSDEDLRSITEASSAAVPNNGSRATTSPVGGVLPTDHVYEAALATPFTPPRKKPHLADFKTLVATTTGSKPRNGRPKSSA